MNIDAIIKNDIDPIKKLNELHTDMKKRFTSSPTKEQCDNLQTYLKNAIQGANSSFFKNVATMVAKKDEEALKYLKDRLKNINYEGAIANNNIDIGKEIQKFVSEKEAAWNTKSSSILGVEEKIKTLKEAIESFEKSKVIPKKDIETIKKDIENITTDIEKYLNDFYDNKENKTTRIFFKDNEQFASKVQELNKVFFKYVFPKTHSEISTVQKGDILEYTLGLLSADAIGVVKERGIEHTYDYMEDILKNIVIGSQKKKYSDGNINLDTKLEANFKDLKKVKKDKDKDTYFINIGGVEISVNKAGVNKFNPYTSTYGKEDVHFLFKEEDGKTAAPFRISAKNYSNLSKLNFETMNLMYSMYRIFNEIPSLKYLLALGNKWDNIKDWHSMAKASVFADALIGFSQKQQDLGGWVDTLVISEKGNIKVISLKEIINNFYNIIETDSNFIGYNGTQIVADLSKIWRTRSKKEVCDSDLLVLMRQHASIAVSLKYNALNKS